MKPWMRPAHAIFAIAWGGNEFTPLLVMYKNEHHLPAVTVNILLFAYVLGIIPALLVGGPLSDRYGRRALLRPAPAIAMLGSLTLAFSHASVALLTAGRVMSGIALGLAMAAGSAWVKELSSPPFDDPAPGAGARRSAMSLTAGFGIGAGVAGTLAQWAPYPDELAFLINVAITAPALVLLGRAPETVTAPTSGRLRDDLKIPAVSHRRFLFVVLPVAPWVFGSAASAYAVLPALMASKVTSAPIAFSALLCLVGLTAGFLIQNVSGHIDRPGSARAVLVALAVVTTAMLTAALTSAKLTIALALLGALLLGLGYGLAMISGLTEIQRIAQPQDLAGLTAVFYSVTYLGFAVPAIMSAVAQTWHLPYWTMFVFGALVALGCLATVKAMDAATRSGTAAATASAPSHHFSAQK